MEATNMRIEGSGPWTVHSPSGAHVVRYVARWECDCSCRGFCAHIIAVLAHTSGGDDITLLSDEERLEIARGSAGGWPGT